jgi:beta-phosphoglucomutase-like phosphatase (HAD superfamily)
VTVPRGTFLGRHESRAIDVDTDLAAPMPGTPAVLGAVRGAGVTTGIGSSARRRWIDLVLARLALEPLDLATSAEAVDGPGKPEPDVYEDAAARVSRAPADCVVVEDSTDGVRAGVAAGCVAVGFRATYDADCDRSGADRAVEGAGGLADVPSERLGVDVTGE